MKWKLESFILTSFVMKFETHCRRPYISQIYNNVYTYTYMLIQTCMKLHMFLQCELWRLTVTYVLRAAKERTCTKFHQNSLKTVRLVCIETDRQTDRHALQTSWQNYSSLCKGNSTKWSFWPVKLAIVILKTITRTNESFLDISRGLNLNNIYANCLYKTTRDNIC